MDVRKIATQFLETRTDLNVSSGSLISQIEHRIGLVEKWGIENGARVLEIGCGQGDCTIVLADAVGEKGHVDALDPGAPDYGAPFTLSQAQSHISSGTYGPRITFHNTDPISYLTSYHGLKYDYVVLSHCLWYFESPSVLSSIIKALNDKTKHLCLAEWSLRASKPAAQPHVLAALLLSLIESKRKIPSQGNIRTILSPSQILKAVMQERDWTVLTQEILPSNEGLKDAFWEVDYALQVREKTLRTLQGDLAPEKELGVVESMFDSIAAGVEILDGGIKGVRSMDVWIAKFAAL